MRLADYVIPGWPKVAGRLDEVLKELVNDVCPYCDTDLRVDADIDSDGRVEVEVSCQNDSGTRTENCLSGVKAYLNLTTETGVWVLRPESTYG